MTMNVWCRQKKFSLSTKILEVSRGIGRDVPPSLLTRSQWNTLGHNSKTRLSSHLKLRYQFFVFIEAYTCYKNQHHSSIQSYHITYLTLRITFDMPKCTWTHQLNGLNQIDIFVYVYHMQKVNFIPKSILINLVIFSPLQNRYIRIKTTTNLKTNY